MKKLMIALAAVALAVGAQAATVSWTCANVKGPDGNALAGGSAYVFFVAGSSADTDAVVASLSGKGATAVATAMAGANKTYTMGTAVAAGNYSYNTTNGFTLPTNADLGLSGSTVYTAYAVIFDSASITDESKFYVTAARTNTTLADSVTNNKQWALTATSSSVSSNWHAVAPEPTSGLLMLVGLGALALRRRRA